MRAMDVVKESLAATEAADFGKLAKLEVASTPNGGVMGILSQLGVNMPGM